MTIDGIPVTDMYPCPELPGRFPPRGGKPLSPRTVAKWRRAGLRAYRLRGLGWYTCDQWVSDFLAGR